MTDGGSTDAAGALAEAARKLREAGCPSPRIDAERLLCFALGTDRAGLYLMHSSPLPPKSLEEYRGMVAKRAARVPLQHITGTVEFHGLPFVCAPGALIPRPETEVLLDRFLDALPRSPRLLLDAGTGSGVLAVCLALRFPEAAVLATDVAMEPLSVAAANAALHGVRISFAACDLLEALDAGFDGIVANLPYIPSLEIRNAQPEVGLHDPGIALDGGPDGLALIRRLVADAPRCLAEGGILALEAAGRQPYRISRLMERSGAWSRVTRGPDLAGKPRWVMATRG